MKPANCFSAIGQIARPGRDLITCAPLRLLHATSTAREDPRADHPGPRGRHPPISCEMREQNCQHHSESSESFGQSKSRGEGLREAIILVRRQNLDSTRKATVALRTSVDFARPRARFIYYFGLDLSLPPLNCSESLSLPLFPFISCLFPSFSLFCIQFYLIIRYICNTLLLCFDLNFLGSFP